MLVSIGRNPYVELRRLVPDVVQFDHDTDKSFPHVMFSCVSIVPITSLSERTLTLGRQPVSRNVW